MMITPPYLPRIHVVSVLAVEWEVGWRNRPGRGMEPRGGSSYSVGMSTIPVIEDDEAEAEMRALAAAIAVAEADPRRVPHEAVRAWLLRLANGEFGVPPPEPR